MAKNNQYKDIRNKISGASQDPKNPVNPLSRINNRSNDPYNDYYG